MPDTAQLVTPVSDTPRTAAPIKLCFLITPMGTMRGAIRSRAEDVFKKYIQPACVQANYDVRSSRDLGGRHVDNDIVNALTCARWRSPTWGARPGTRTS